MRFAGISYSVKAAVISLAVALSLFTAPPPASAAGTAVVSVSAPTQPISPGTQFTVNITVQPNNSIAGVQFNLSFNPSMVTVNSVTEGNLLKQNGASTYFMPGTIDNTAGTITGVAGAITSPGQTVSNPGTFAVITLTARSVRGTCPLTLLNVVVGDINGQPVTTSTVNGQVSINRPPVLNSIGSKSPAVGQLLSFSISATDPDGDTLTYSASNLPSGASFNSSSRTFSWTPAYGQVGTYANVHFEASDGMSISSENISITVGKATPAFSNLSSPTINFGTTPTSFGGTIKAGTLIPTGNVSITFNGVTQPVSISGTGNFSSTFATGSLGTSGSPYTISYAYAGDANFSGISDNSKTLTVNPITATVTLGSLNQTYDGTPRTVTANTTPTGLSVSVTYSGSTTPPTNAGNYSVVAAITSPNYSGNATGTLAIARVTPAFSNLSSPTIDYGTTPTSLGGTIKAGSLIPTGNASITLSGVTQSASINGSGNFSSSFATGTLGTSGSPYVISFFYAGDTNFNSTSDNNSRLTVIQPFSAWDVNTDGAVNVLDLISVSQQWGASGAAGWIPQDVKGDGAIDVLDLILIGQHWTG